MSKVKMTVPSMYLGLVLSSFQIGFKYCQQGLTYQEAERKFKHYIGFKARKAVKHSVKCPWGKMAQSQCTPLRAADCAKNDICGKKI